MGVAGFVGCGATDVIFVGVDTVDEGGVELGGVDGGAGGVTVGGFPGGGDGGVVAGGGLGATGATQWDDGEL